jgi:hypothetical protein
VPPAAAAEAAQNQSTTRDTLGARPFARAAGSDILPPDGATRWRIVDGQVQRSTTEGKTWDVVTLPPSAITAGHAPAASILWLVGRGGAIFVTTDGARFDQVPFVSTADLVAVVASDDRQATVTAADGRRFHTTDRGRSWMPQ